VIVADASVALKWFKEEPGSAAARAVLLEEPLIAPELILAEVLNAGWKAVRLGVMADAQLHAIAAELPLCFARLADLASLTAAATRAAVELDHPVYDCFYLALTEREAATLVTADTRLAAKVAGTRWSPRVALLATANPRSPL
jgi:predicted nucleic acid-binding protein